MLKLGIIWLFTHTISGEAQQIYLRFCAKTSLFPQNVHMGSWMSVHICHHIEEYKGWAKEWSLGCVIPVSWPPLAAWGMFHATRGVILKRGSPGEPRCGSHENRHFLF